MMATARLNTTTISDWQSFHEEGMNMDAWIDCLTYLDEGHGMSRFHLAEGEAQHRRLALSIRRTFMLSARRSKGQRSAAVSDDKQNEETRLEQQVLTRRDGFHLDPVAGSGAWV